MYGFAGGVKKQKAALGFLVVDRATTGVELADYAEQVKELLDGRGVEVTERLPYRRCVFESGAPPTERANRLANSMYEYQKFHQASGDVDRYVMVVVLPPHDALLALYVGHLAPSLKCDRWHIFAAVPSTTADGKPTFISLA